jgi:hypothetical protein
MPKYEYKPIANTNITKGMTPIWLTLKGKLKIPVPIAAAKSARMAPLMAPSLIGPKTLLTKDLFS